MAAEKQIPIGRFIFWAATVVVLAVAPWAIATAYVTSSGMVADGVVTAKREAILFSEGDAWERIREVTYRYKPLDEPYERTESQQVNDALFMRLRVGSPVRVRYSPWRPLRFVKNWGSFLDGSSAVARLGFGLEAARDLAAVLAVLFAGFLGWLAYRARSKALGVVAAFIAGAAFPVVLLAVVALLGVPVLFLASRRKPGEGYGLLLLALIIASAAVVYWRIPRPSRLPPGPVRSTMAVASQVHSINEIWTSMPNKNGGDAGGQQIGQTFQAVDLEFTPEGSLDSMHAVDFVDTGSVPGLRQGSLVRINYSAAEPRTIEIPGATSIYVQAALVSLGKLAGIVAIVATFFLWLSGVLSRKATFFLNPRNFAMRIPRERLEQQLSNFPAGDPRRQALEAYLRTSKERLPAEPGYGRNKDDSV